MTTRREVPITGDTLAWVHGELAEIKNRLTTLFQATEQSRALASELTDRIREVATRIDQFENYGPGIIQAHEEIRVIKDHLVRMHEDINSLRQSREDSERHMLAESDRQRKENNDLIRRVTETQRLIEGWQERIVSTEEHNRRNLEGISQVALKIEGLQGEQEASETRYARLQVAFSRIDQDLNRLSASIPELFREDETQKERFQSLAEMLRRFESELDAVRQQTLRINRIDDRLELVQAERSRHGERINELTAELDLVKEAVSAQIEKSNLIDARIAGYQEDIRNIGVRVDEVRSQFVTYLQALAEIEADFRKRQVAALEKEIRDLRSRALSLGEE